MSVEYFTSGPVIYKGSQLICICVNNRQAKAIVTAVNFYLDLLGSKDNPPLRINEEGELIIDRSPEVGPIKDVEEEEDSTSG